MPEVGSLCKIPLVLLEQFAGAYLAQRSFHRFTALVEFSDAFSRAVATQGAGYWVLIQNSYGDKVVHGSKFLPHIRLSITSWPSCLSQTSYSIVYS
jgi:hypothetical protein